MAVKRIRTIRILAIIIDEVKEFELHDIRYILNIVFYLVSITLLYTIRYTYNRGNREKTFNNIAGNKIP